MGTQVFLSGLTAWAPGLLSDKDAWTAWAQGSAQITRDVSQPALAYTEPLFRRRLSQLSRMTIETVHNLVETAGCSRQTKIVFASCRGELSREFKINSSLINDGMVLPAAFSLSVFNTPVALATIALHMNGGYSAVYPSKGSFRSAFEAAAAPVICGSEPQVVFVYGDELIPEEYGTVSTEPCDPFSFAVLVSAEKPSGTSFCLKAEEAAGTPADFLKAAIAGGALPE